MRVVLWLLGLYAAGATAAFWRLARRLQRAESLAPQLAGLGLETLPPDARVEALSKLAAMRHQEIPWFERSLSTAGVIAFFSMLIATGVQTGKAAIESLRVEDLKAELKTLESRRAGLEGVVTQVARAVLQQYQQTGHLDLADEDALRLRLGSLAEEKSPGKETVLEMYQLALVLGDFDRAITILDAHQGLLDQTVPADLMTLAEYYAITRADAAARDCLRRLEPSLSSQPVAVQARAIVIGALLDDDVEKHVPELSSLLRVDAAAARRKLKHDVLRYQEAAARLSAR